MSLIGNLIDLQNELKTLQDWYEKGMIWGLDYYQRKGEILKAIDDLKQGV